MKPRILIQRDDETGTYLVRLFGPDDLLAEVGSLLDAERIARGISAWTQFPVYEATNG